jgi:hypothetical protein
MVKDATADYSEDHMHAALDINLPNYASAIVTTKGVIESIFSFQTLETNSQYRTWRFPIAAESSLCTFAQG